MTGMSENFDGNLAQGRPNPFVHFRFTALVSPPSSAQVYAIPGFFAADGTEGDPCTGDIGPGCVWKFRFTPDEQRGTWTYTVVLDAGDGMSFGYASYPLPGGGTDLVPANLSTKAVATGPISPTGVLGTQLGSFTSVGVDPQGEGFYSKGFLRVDKSAATGTTYYRFSRQRLSDEERYFIKLGVNSPENFFGYREFYKTLKDPLGFDAQVHPFAPTTNPATVFGGTGGWHQYDAEEAGVMALPGLEVTHTKTHWTLGLPEWVTTSSEMQRSYGAPTAITLDTTYYHSNSQACMMTTPWGDRKAGHGIVGALQYLHEQDLNAIYVIPMNLGGDGKDTYPFATVHDYDVFWYAGHENQPPSGSGHPQVLGPQEPWRLFQYSVKRMQEWNTVLEFAMSRGIFVQMLLHEQERANLHWLGYDWNPSAPLSPIQLPNSASHWIESPRLHLRHARQLYIKMMLALFGHHPGLQWNLCEENQWRENFTPPLPHMGGPVPVQFTLRQLEAMARWIEYLQPYYDHPITVHARGGDEECYEHILRADPYGTSSTYTVPGTYNPGAGQTGAGDWIDAVSFYVYGDGPVTMGSDTYDRGNEDLPAAPHEFDAKSESLRAMVESTNVVAPGWGVPTRLALSVDEQGNWKWGASGRNFQTLLNANQGYATDASSATERRRVVLWDTLLSGCGLEWYFGYGHEADGWPIEPPFTQPNPSLNQGGSDISCEEFMSRSELWQHSRAARAVLETVPYWRGTPQDSLITNECNDGDPPGTRGEAQVLAFTSQLTNDVDDVFLVIYFPEICPMADPLGDLDLSFAPVNTVFSGIFYDPATGVALGPSTPFMNGDDYTKSPPDTAGIDVLLVVRQL